MKRARSPPDVPELPRPQRVAVPGKPSQVVRGRLPAREALEILPLGVVQAVARGHLAELAQRERGDVGGSLRAAVSLVGVQPLLLGPRLVVREHPADVVVAGVVDVLEKVGHGCFYCW